MRHEYFAELDGPQSHVAPGRRMILCKGGGNQTTTQQIPEELKPLAKRYSNMAIDLSKGQYQPYEDNRFAGFNGNQNAALDMISQRARQGSPTNDNAEAQLNQVLSSGPNPYLDQTYNHAADAVRSNFNTAAINSGSFGNANLQDQFQSNLGDLATQIYGGAYDADQNRKLQAISMAPNIANQDYNDAQQLLNAGQIQQDQQQQGLDFDYSQFQDQQNDPYKRLAALSGVFNSNLGGTSSTSGGGGK